MSARTPIDHKAEAVERDNFEYEAFRKIRPYANLKWTARFVSSLRFWRFEWTWWPVIIVTLAVIFTFWGKL